MGKQYQKKERKRQRYEKQMERLKGIIMPITFNEACATTNTREESKEPL